MCCTIALLIHFTRDYISKVGSDITASRHSPVMESADLLPTSASEQQSPNLTIPFTPRYAEHFVGAAALIGAFGLVFGAMALGETLYLEPLLGRKHACLRTITIHRRLVIV